MRDWWRTHATTVKVAVVAVALTAYGPAMAASVYDAVNADKVDGKHAVGAGASASARAGKLVATNSQGRLPNGIIAKAPDADKLDGISSLGFARSNHTHRLTDHVGEPCVVDQHDGHVAITINDTNGVYHFTCVETPPTLATTESLQNGSIPAGSFVRLEDTVSTGTTTTSDRGWMQLGTGPYTGILVDPRSGGMPAAGTAAHIEGVLEEINGVTTITDAQLTANFSPPPVPAPTVRTPTELAAGAEPYESVLLAVNNVTVTSANDSEFTVSDGTTSLIVDDLAYNWATPPVGTQYSSLTGVLYQAGAFKLEPRSAADMVAN